MLSSDWRKDPDKKKKALGGLNHKMFELDVAEPDSTPQLNVLFAEDGYTVRPREIAQYTSRRAL